MGTKLSLTADGVLVRNDGRRTVELQRSRLFAMDALDLPISRHVFRSPGVAGPAPAPNPAPAPQPTEQSAEPGRPRIPLPSMVRSPLDLTELALPGRLVHVARLDLADPTLKEAWGKSIRRTAPVVRHAALWGDLITRSPRAIADHLKQQAERRIVPDARTLNVLLLRRDLANPIDLTEVASKGAEIDSDFQTVQIYYVPGT